ncbi:MAG: FliI/YscN family ATPase [Rhodosalinus sp.]
MDLPRLEHLGAALGRLDPVRALGRVAAVEGGLLRVRGLAGARLGDRLELRRRDGGQLCGEILRLTESEVVMLPEADAHGVSLGDPVALAPPPVIAPHAGWIGRVIDPFGRPLDGAPLLPGPVPRPLLAVPPAPGRRRGFGPRLDTGLALFNTALPVARGQRLGLFAGSGVGKSTLLAQLARGMEADVVVLALVGERGRELRDFVESALGPGGMRRSVIVAATSDRSPLLRRRCLFTAMAVAEHFRDAGRHVLLLADSVTRLAEAHREVAAASGELPALRGFPPSTGQMIMALAERAGPGEGDTGDITALFTVLVAGSDMEEPVADILRGVLDGHVVLDRAIAERGRFPAVDLTRSVSRSLPAAASAEENAAILRLRALVAAHEGAEPMIRAGLYTEGSDAEVDQALRVWPEVERFLAEPERQGIEQSFRRLNLILRRADAGASARSRAVVASG